MTLPSGRPLWRADLDDEIKVLREEIATLKAAAREYIRLSDGRIGGWRSDELAARDALAALVQEGDT